MNGKGSNQRPCQVSKSEYAENWERTFAGGGQAWREMSRDLRESWERPHKATPTSPAR